VRYCVACLVVLALVVACSEAPRADRLRILLRDDISSLDPNQEFESITDSVLFNVYEPLVTFDKDLHVQPLIAEFWENPLPEQWRLHLRKNVRFHDGTLLTAGLVKDLLLKLQADKDLESSALLNNIQKIVAENDHTLSIHTRKSYSILTKLPFIYITKPARQAGTLAGTGPYKIDKWEKGKSIRLSRNEHYWQGRPQFETVEFLSVPDADQRFQMLMEKKADIIYSVPPEMTGRKLPGIQFVRRPGLGVMYLGFNLRLKKQNPFLDLRVRKAFHLAIDRQTIIDRALYGNGAIPTQPVAPAVFGYNPELPPPACDLQMARKLLAESGYGKGLRVRLDFHFTRLHVARIIKDQLARINVEIELNALQRNSVYEIAEAGMSELFLVGWDCSSGDATEFFEFCAHTPGKNYGTGNYGCYSNFIIDQIAESTSTMISELDRRKNLNKAATIIMEELPIIPLFVEDDIYAMREGISFEPRADNEIRVQDVTYAKR